MNLKIDYATNGYALDKAHLYVGHISFGCSQLKRKFNLFEQTISHYLVRWVKG